MAISDEFKVDEHGFTYDGYGVLPKRSVGAMYVANAVAFVITLVLFYALYYFVISEYDVPRIIKILMLALFATITLYLLVSPPIYYARYRYKIDEDRIDIRHGILFITHDIVPIERIHQLSVSRGPINNMFRLADVTITTAGGNVVIKLLEVHTAEDIADKLNEYIVELLKKRE